MAQPIFILRLSGPSDADSEPAIGWLDGRDHSQGTGSPTEIARMAAGCRLLALVPARDVLLLEAELPTRNRQRLLKALPFALEEQLTAEVDTLHFALAPKLEAGKARVAVVDKGLMAAWHQALQQVGLEAQAMLPESLAVPLEPDGWSLLVTRESAVLRSGPLAAAVVPVGEVENLVRFQLDQAGDAAPKHLECFSEAEDENAAAAVGRICEQAGIEFRISPSASLPALFLQGLEAAPAMDLQQGEFGRSSRFERHWKTWRSVAAMLAVLLVLQLALAVLDYLDLRQRDEQLRSQIEQVYRDAFPESRNVVDPRLQMEQHLRTLQQSHKGDVFLDLLARTGPLFKAASAFEIEAMRYRQSALEVDIRVKDFATLDGLKASLGGLEGVQVTVESANAEAGMVRGQLRIQRADS